MIRFVRNIDVQRFAGINTILGVDLTNESARVVELKRKGNPFSKMRARFEVQESFELPFGTEETLDEKARMFQEMLKEKRVKTKFVVSAIRSSAIKREHVVVPHSVDDINEWIEENWTTLLRIAIPRSEISYGVEVLGYTDAGQNVELTFVKKKEAQWHEQFFEKAGVELLTLSAGSRDVLNVIFGSRLLFTREEFTLTVPDGDGVLTSYFRDGKEQRREYVFRDLLGGNVSEYAAISNHLQRDADGVMEREGGPDRLDVQGHLVLKPFDLSPEYALAAGLALKGFIPELNPVNFVSSEKKARTGILTERALLQRTVISCGAIIFVLLLVQTMASIYLQGRIQAVDKKILEMGPLYHNVANLESQVQTLQEEYEGKRIRFRRSNTARVLHEAAGSLPSEVWLDKLAIEKKGVNPCLLHISGFAKTSEEISAFLKALKQNEVCSDVSVVRIGTEQQLERAAFTKGLPLSSVSFEIKGTIKEE